jgi:hypothetical protein
LEGIDPPSPWEAPPSLIYMLLLHKTGENVSGYIINAHSHIVRILFVDLVYMKKYLFIVLLVGFGLAQKTAVTVKENDSEVKLRDF